MWGHFECFCHSPSASLNTHMAWVMEGLRIALYDLASVNMPAAKTSNHTGSSTKVNHRPEHWWRLRQCYKQKLELQILLPIWGLRSLNIKCLECIFDFKHPLGYPGVGFCTWAQILNLLIHTSKFELVEKKKRFFTFRWNATRRRLRLSRCKKPLSSLPLEHQHACSGCHAINCGPVLNGTKKENGEMECLNVSNFMTFQRAGWAQLHRSREDANPQETSVSFWMETLNFGLHSSPFWLFRLKCTYPCGYTSSLHLSLSSPRSHMTTFHDLFIHLKIQPIHHQ